VVIVVIVVMFNWVVGDWMMHLVGHDLVARVPKPMTMLDVHFRVMSSLIVVAEAAAANAAGYNEDSNDDKIGPVEPSK
jgi:hypothetical protein